MGGDSFSDHEVEPVAILVWPYRPDLVPDSFPICSFLRVDDDVSVVDGLIHDRQSCCEQLLGRRLDKSSFRRKLADRNLIEPVAGGMRTGANRPAQIYQLRAD